MHSFLHCESEIVVKLTFFETRMSFLVRQVVIEGEYERWVCFAVMLSYYIEILAAMTFQHPN